MHLREPRNARFFLSLHNLSLSFLLGKRLHHWTICANLHHSEEVHDAGISARHGQDLADLHVFSLHAPTPGVSCCSAAA